MQCPMLTPSLNAIVLWYVLLWVLLTLVSHSRMCVTQRPVNRKTCFRFWQRMQTNTLYEIWTCVPNNFRRNRNRLFRFLFLDLFLDFCFFLGRASKGEDEIVDSLFFVSLLFSFNDNETDVKVVLLDGKDDMDVYSNQKKGNGLTKQRRKEELNIFCYHCPATNCVTHEIKCNKFFSFCIVCLPKAKSCKPTIVPIWNTWLQTTRYLKTIYYGCFRSWIAFITCTWDETVLFMYLCRCTDLPMHEESKSRGNYRRGLDRILASCRFLFLVWILRKVPSSQPTQKHCCHFSQHRPCVWQISKQGKHGMVSNGFVFSGFWCELHVLHW